jgi:hypothetical protein
VAAGTKPRRTRSFSVNTPPSPIDSTAQGARSIWPNRSQSLRDEFFDHPGIKIGHCDLCHHILLVSKSGFFKRIGFSSDEPGKFVELCKSIMLRLE